MRDTRLNPARRRGAATRVLTTAAICVRATAVTRARATTAVAGVLLGVGLLLSTALSTGCKPPTTPATASNAALPEVRRDTPDHAAVSLVEHLRAGLRAVAAHDRAAAAEIDGQAAAELIARDAIQARLRKNVGEMSDPDAFFGKLVSNWGTCLAAYANGMKLDQLRTTPISDGVATAVVEIPANGPASAITIELACVRDAAGQWRVRDFNLVPPARSVMVFPASPGGPVPPGRTAPPGNAATAPVVGPPIGATTTSAPATP